MRTYCTLTISRVPVFALLASASLMLIFVVSTTLAEDNPGCWKGRSPVAAHPQVLLHSARTLVELDASAPRFADSNRDGWEVIEFQDFEGTFPGESWVVDSEQGYTDAFWGASDCLPWAGDYSAFCAAEGPQAVACQEDYPNEMNAWMMYGPFDLSVADSAWFDWHFWLNLEGDENQAGCPDDMFVGISEDGFNFLGWSLYSDDCENGVPQNQWLFYGADMTDYVGQDSVWIAFVFRSNSSGSKTEGAHVDDVTVWQYLPVGIGEETPSHSPVPRTYSLFQNYPNPFNPSTTISFDIPGTPGTAQAVNLTIYDLRGRRVRTLVDAELEPGSHRIHWNGCSDTGGKVSSGIYLYTLSAGDRLFTRKMAILK
jgi:hypothetical protein